MPRRIAFPIWLLLAVWCSSSGSQLAAEGLKAPTRTQSALQGEYYEAVVPDTLDLAERARLAVNAIIGSVDPNNNYEVFQCAHCDQQPANFNHNWGGPCLAKAIDVIPQMRRMSGSRQHEDYDMKIVDSFLTDVDAHGLWWIRTEGRPYRKGFEKDIHWPFPQGRMVVALIAWYDYDRNPEWLPIIKTLVGGLHKVAGQDDQRAWFVNSRTPLDLAPEPASVEMQINGNPLRALSQWYELRSDEETRELAEKLTRFMSKPGLWGNTSEGPSMVDAYQHARWLAHFHWFTTGVVGMMEYAVATHDVKMLRYMKSFYEYSRQFGSVRMGFFPAVISTLKQRRAAQQRVYGGKGQNDEGCALAEMIYIAIRLSEAGVGDYWDDVDSMVRNHLVEHQMLDRERLKHIIAHSPKFKMRPGINNTEDVIERNIGAFTSCAEPTKMYAWWTMCCNANMMWALYEAWEAAVRFDNGTAQVNLLLNRASPWVDIDSHLPYEGKVVLRNKKASRMTVRIPLWADKREVRIEVNGRETPPEWLGRQLLIRGLEPNDAVTITFPMVETTETHTEPSYEMTYTCHFKGNTLIDISPRPEEFSLTRISSDDGAFTKLNKDMGYPLYQREHMKADKAPMKKVTRYVHQH